MPVVSIGQQHPATTNFGGANIPYSGLEYQANFIPEYLIYIFNISARTFVDSAGRGIIGRIKLLAPGVVEGSPTDVTVSEDGKKSFNVIAGRADQPYSYVTSFPHPMPIPKFNDVSGEIETKKTDGRRFVVDMISPDNLTLTLDAVVPPENVYSQGNDYAPKGIFFSFHNPPLKDDLEKAYRRMEHYYKDLNERAATLEMTDKIGLQAAIQSNPDHVYAANYYGKEFAWARTAVRPVTCSNCGEQKPSGRPFHMTSYSALCVEQTPDAWRAVVNSGVRKYSDVPDDFKWKKKDASAPDE